VNTFSLATVGNRPYDVAKAMEDSPVMIVDGDGRPFGVFLLPDEFYALQEVAEIARDPELYAQAVAPAQSDVRTASLSDVLSRD
jgi:hypothetical protein